MSPRAERLVLVAEVALLLLPLTFVTALLAWLGYAAYPISGAGWPQRVFDNAMLLQSAAIVAAWRLVSRYWRDGRRGLRATSRVWSALVGVGAAIGVAGASIALAHWMDPMTAGHAVGFSLLAPAAALLPMYLHFAVERRLAARR